MAAGASGERPQNMDTSDSPNDTFIIGAGFGRTGTSSMQIALKKLGWRSYHMREVFGNGKEAMNSLIEAGKLKCAARKQMNDYDPSFDNFNQMVMASDTFDWNQVFVDKDGAKYNATVDFPVCAFYLDLMEFYPNYKVILTVRDDPEQWYGSVDRTIRQFEILMGTYALRFVNWMRGTDFNTMRNVTYGHLIFDQPLGNVLDDPFADKQKSMRTYENWIEGVKKHVPEEKLLVFNVKQGWEPLCAFLGVDAPDEPFPRSNETKHMIELIEAIKRRVRMMNAVAVGGTALLMAGTAYLVQKYRGGR